MQPLQAEVTTKDSKKLESIKNRQEGFAVRFGAFFKKLDVFQKRRFNRIAGTIARKYKVGFINNPLETLLIRQIAMNTMKIEEAELSLLDGTNERYVSDVEKWLFLAQKERREAMLNLVTISKSMEKKSGTSKFSDLRDELREEQGLEKSKETEPIPDGHDRRSYDDITRTAK